jgi:hypothetical protein
VDLHPDIRIQKLTIGAERAPLLVIDNLVADAEPLVSAAAAKHLEHSTRFYPGVRAKAPLSYQQLIATRLKDLLSEYFQLEGRSVRFSMCHYSLVTTPAQNLAPLQRIPHVDSLGHSGLASIHYLFRGDLGGTAFYRHRKTGFEFIDESRQEPYFRCLQNEIEGPDAPGASYINGDTALFERVAAQDGVFNRMLVYRRNSLHSGSIGPDFVPDPNPLTGRLSINSFIDLGG